MDEEAQRCFAGDISPEQAAAAIQSRADIYLAEQYGWAAIKIKNNPGPGENPGAWIVQLIFFFDFALMFNSLISFFLSCPYIFLAQKKQ